MTPKKGPKKFWSLKILKIQNFEPPFLGSFWALGALDPFSKLFVAWVLTTSDFSTTFPASFFTVTLLVFNLGYKVQVGLKLIPYYLHMLPLSSDANFLKHSDWKHKCERYLLFPLQHKRIQNFVRTAGLVAEIWIRDLQNALECYAPDRDIRWYLPALVPRPTHIHSRLLAKTEWKNWMGFGVFFFCTALH